MMNWTIDHVNAWGELWRETAAPLFWQSSLLIALVLALEWLWRGRLRPAVRYGLWLVVLVKLLLPPSLALPSGAAWWLRREAAVERGVVTVRSSSGPQLAPIISSAAPQGAMAPPRSTLTATGGALLIWMAGMTGLLGWIWRHGRRLQQMVRRADGASDGLCELVAAAKRELGLRRCVRICVTDEAVTPAVCGLWNAVLVLPQGVVTRLEAAEMRAVLLHELMHLRRGDLWLNWAQAVLQVVYWWHPLVWLANARIGRVREEAVDDAVMVALAEQEEAYVPALVRVAKLGLERRPFHVGFVGIFETRSALRQRVERLLQEQRPRAAGLSAVSICGIVIFGLVTLPMGCATSAEKESASLAAVAPPTVVTNSVPAQAGGPPQILVEARFIEVFDSGAGQNPAREALHAWLRPGVTNTEAVESRGAAAVRERFAQPENLRLTVSMNPTRAGVLTGEQTKELLRTLSESPHVDVLSAPKVTTLSGRAARIAIQESRTLVVGVETNAAAGGADRGAVSYQTKTFQFGPELDLHPEWDAAGERIRLQVQGWVTEFLGYDHSEKAWRSFEFEPGKPGQYQQPLPHIRVREMAGEVAVRAGDSFLLGGPVVQDTLRFKDKIPVLGDIPLLGRLFRSESTGTQQKELFLLVMPKVVRPTGEIYPP